METSDKKPHVPNRQQCLKACRMFEKVVNQDGYKFEYPDLNASSNFPIVYRKFFDALMTHFAAVLGTEYSCCESSERIGARRHALTYADSLLSEEADYSDSNIECEMMCDDWEKRQSSLFNYAGAFQNAYYFDINGICDWQDLMATEFLPPELADTDIDKLAKEYSAGLADNKTIDEMGGNLVILRDFIKDNMFAKFTHPKETADVLFKYVLDIFDRQNEYVEIRYGYLENTEVIPFSRWLLNHKEVYRKEKLICDTIVKIAQSLKKAPRPFVERDDGFRRVGDSIIFLAFAGGYTDGYSNEIMEYNCNPPEITIGCYLYEPLMAYIKEKYGFSA